VSLAAGPGLGPGTRPAAHVRTTGTVRIVGTGLLGASIGLGLRALGVDVVLHDPSPTARALARDLGAGRLPGEDEPEPSLVVVAAPPDVTADVVADELAAHPHAVVTDVASVKGRPLQALLALGPGMGELLVRYVGGHPLAGRERSGAVAARPDLFRGRPWVLTPTSGTDRWAVDRVRDLVLDLGAVPTEMPAQAHDRAVARVSHVPQVAASLVAARLVDAEDDAVSLAGQGLRDVTRVAASDTGLWVQILGANAGPVADVLSALREDLDSVIAALRSLDQDADAPGARAALARSLDAGVRGRARIPGKHGAAPTSFAVVTVQVPDEPGALAKILAAMGEAGVNLEDLRLEHVPDRLVGLAEVSVLPAVKDRLEQVLLAGGWTLAG